MYSDKKNKNRGFSFVELLVVIAIMIVLTGAAVYGFGMINGGNRTKAIKSIADSANKLRSYTLSKDGKWKMEIFNSDGEYQVNIYCGTKDEYGNYNYELKEQGKIGSRIVVYFGYNMDENSISKEQLYEIGTGDKVVIEFDRSNGSISNIETNIKNKLESTDKKFLIMCDRKDGNKNGECVTLYRSTGKIGS